MKNEVVLSTQEINVRNYDEIRSFIPFMQDINLNKIVKLYIQSPEEYDRDDFDTVHNGICLINQLFDTISNMPITYEQDGKGNDAVAYLHYFSPNADWYITEKDKEGGIKQAFGFVILGRMPECAELGYINIEELTNNKFVELDYYFEPMTLKEIKSQHGLI